MDYYVEVLRLSQKFYKDYPKSKFPEILEKDARAYACLLIDIKEYTICIPYRTNIPHQNAFHFKNSQRSQNNDSGLDYSKMVITKNNEYIENVPAVIDKDEYNETMIHIEKIITDALEYISTYCNHIKGDKVLHHREFSRKYGYSTLSYFHDELNLN